MTILNMISTAEAADAKSFNIMDVLSSIDGVIAIPLMVLILFGGVASAAPTESAETGIMLVSLMLIYFLTVNLMRTKLWLKRVISMLTASATAVSLYGIWLYRGVEANAVSGRMASPFLLAEYIIMVIPFAFAVFLHSHKAGTKIVYFVSAESESLFQFGKGDFFCPCLPGEMTIANPPDL